MSDDKEMGLGSAIAGTVGGLAAAKFIPQYTSGRKLTPDGLKALEEAAASAAQTHSDAVIGGWGKYYEQPGTPQGVKDHYIGKFAGLAEAEGKFTFAQASKALEEMAHDEGHIAKHFLEWHKAGKEFVAKETAKFAEEAAQSAEKLKNVGKLAGEFEKASFFTKPLVAFKSAGTPVKVALVAAVPLTAWAGAKLFARRVENERVTQSEGQAR